MIQTSSSQNISKINTTTSKLNLEVDKIKLRLKSIDPQFSVALYGSTAYNSNNPPRDLDLLVSISRSSSLRKVCRQLSEVLCDNPFSLKIDNGTINMWKSEKIDALRIGGITSNKIPFGIHIFAHGSLIHNYTNKITHSINILMPNSAKYTEKKYLEVDTFQGWRAFPCEYTKISEEKIIVKQYFSREDSANNTQVLGVLFDKFITAIPLFDYKKASLVRVQKTIIAQLQSTIRTIASNNLSLLFVKAKRFDQKYCHQLRSELFYGHA